MGTLSTLPAPYSVARIGYLHFIKYKATYQPVGLYPGGLCRHHSSQGKQDWARSAFELNVHKVEDKGGIQVAELTEQNAHGQ